MSPIGFPPPSVRFPILSESARPAPNHAGDAVRDERRGSISKTGTNPGEKTSRPERSARPTDIERPDRPADAFHRGRAKLAHATRHFVDEAKAIMHKGGTMEDVAALARDILEKIPALEKFPPFQNILKRIAYNLNNGPVPVDPVPIDPVPIDPVPIDPGGLDPTGSGASLKKPETEIAVEPGTTLPLTGVSIVV